MSSKGSKERPSIFLQHTSIHEAGHILMCLKQDVVVHYAFIRESKPGIPSAGETFFEDTPDKDKNLRLTIAGMIALKVLWDNRQLSWKDGSHSDIREAMKISSVREFEVAKEEVERYFREPKTQTHLNKIAALLLEKRAVNRDDIFDALDHKN